MQGKQHYKFPFWKTIRRNSKSYRKHQSLTFISIPKHEESGREKADNPSIK